LRKVRILHVSPALAAVLAIGLAVSACSSLGQVTEAEQQQILATAQAPRLQSGEKIRVTVYNEPSLSGDFQIDPSGFVSLPLAGTLKAGGLTQNELEQALAQKYSSQYLKNPNVTVSVAEYRPFYIIGEVEHPGSFPYTSGLKCAGHRRRPHLSGQQIDGHDPASGRERAEGIRHGCRGADPARRHHQGAPALLLACSDEIDALTDVIAGVKPGHDDSVRAENYRSILSVFGAII
jgi:hypothetical protein